MQTNQNLPSKKFTITQKILIGFNALIALSASGFIYWAIPAFKEFFDAMGMSAKLPASTRFILDWHLMLMWLPVVWMFLMLAFCYKDAQRGGGRTLVGTLLGCIALLIMVIVPMYFPHLNLTSISGY